MMTWEDGGSGEGVVDHQFSACWVYLLLFSESRAKAYMKVS